MSTSRAHRIVFGVVRLEAGTGGRVTFEEFAKARLGALLRFSTVLTNDRGLGEDLVQDVMMRAHTQWDHIGQLDAPAAYVRRMLVNEFVSWRRKWARIVPRSDIAALMTHRTEPDHADAHAERTAIADEIGKLSRRQRAVIILRYYEDLPDAEIADLLGCTPSTVRAHAMRALRALRVESREPVSGARIGDATVSDWRNR
jgi:RNA polymerase sigma-70 factor (sigma-E family)